MSIHLIDELCDEFESAVRQGKTVMIEDFLLKVDDEEERKKLLRELIEIETELAADAGVNPVVKRDELKRRFPEEEDLINSIINRVAKERQIGDYEIIEELGHGGMGIVYKARQKLLNQTVAVKILSQTLLNDPQAIGRFRREMQLIGRLNHPNIVRALNAGETDETHYLAMEFIDGITLQQIVNQKTTVPAPPQEGNNSPPSAFNFQLPAAAACEIIRQASLGLQHAHQFGLVHRDIKPANLMLDKTGTVKILDLGLGKFLGEHRASEETASLTQAGATIGTVDYMSPEQCDNAEMADIRSDIYSLGCTLYYLLTGLPPYSGSRYDTTRKKLMAHIVGEIPNVRNVNPNIPKELQAVLAKMLAKEPKDRYQMPNEVAEAVEPFADFNALFALCGSPSSRAAMPPTNSKMTGRTMRIVSPQNSIPVWKKYAAGIGLAFLVLVLGFSPYFLSPHSDTDEKQRLSPPSLNTVNDDAAVRSTLRTDLALLPGLNGSWWFVEMPLYMPFVRERLVNKIDTEKDLKTLFGENPEFYYDPNVSAVYARLEKTVNNFRNDFLPKELQLLNKLLEINGDVPPEEIYQEALNDWKAAGGGRANHLHTQAVLEHHLAVLRNSKTLAAEASKHYADAVLAYQKETLEKETQTAVPASRLLEFLCLSDAARLEYFATGNYNAAMQKFAEVLSRRRTGERSCPLFVAELYAAHGTLCAEAGKYDDSLFIRGRERLDRSKTGQRLHPLAAQLAERYAWSLLDQWKVNEASKQFESALVIRATNRQESGNRYAAVFALHDLHGLALSLRYRGDFSKATDNFRRTLTSVDTTMQEKELPPDTGCYEIRWYNENLRSRAANTRERLADCTLYGGAASGMFGQGRLNEVAKLYEEAANFYDSEGTRRTMLGKQAIVLLLQDKIEEAEQIFCQLDEQKRNLLGNQQRSDLVRQLADALLSYKKDTEKTPEERRRLLRRFLEQFSVPGNPYSTDAERRETLELRLFAAEFLVDQALDNKDVKNTAMDAPALMQPFGFFMNRYESRPFVQRFCDLMIRASTFLYNNSPDDAAKQRHLRSIVRLLGWLRLPDNESENAPPDSPDTLPVLIVFFFTDDTSDGFVLYYPQDERSGALYPLALTRQQIKSGHKKNAPEWKLDDRLLDCVQKDREANRPVKILWSDEPAWARPEDALHDSDYPFDAMAVVGSGK